MLTLEINKYRKQPILFVIFIGLFFATFLLPFILSGGREPIEIQIYEDMLQMHQRLMPADELMDGDNWTTWRQQQIHFYEETIRLIQEEDWDTLLDITVANGGSQTIYIPDGRRVNTSDFIMGFFLEDQAVQERGLTYLPRFAVRPHGLPLWNYWWQVLGGGNTYIFLLITLWVVFAFSFEERNKLKELTNVSPLSLVKLFLSKWLINVGILLEIVLLAVILTSLVVGLRNGIGAANYPIALMYGLSDWEIVDISRIVFADFGFLFFWILAISAIGLVLSLFINHVVVQLIVLLGGLTILREGNVAGRFSSAFQPFLPMNYLDFTQVTNRRDFHHLIGIVTRNGYLTLLGLTITMLILTSLLLKLKKKW